MKHALFGTDGIRGKAGEYPIIPEIAFLLGNTFSSLTEGNRFLIGMDTRESSFSLATAVAAGCDQAGAKADLAGVVPTPVLAYSIHTQGYAGGIMVTASHNPFHDNGLKLFGLDGQKIPDTVQDRIEASMSASKENHYPAPVPSESSMNTDTSAPYLDAYLDHLEKLGIFPESGSGLLPVDCANGAATPLFHRINGRLSSPVRLIAANPDGRNINTACGAAQPDHLHPDSAALDGDGDRILFKDTAGHLITGDHLLMFLADQMDVTGMVGTVMTNQAVEQYCRKRNIPFRRSEVGDRHVRYQMDDSGSNLGGETSGHLIYDPLNPTGDGTGIYLLVSHLMQKEKVTLLDIWNAYPQMPQQLLNFPVSEKVPLDDIPDFSRLLRQTEETISRYAGRIFPRYSGTENLLRILIESTSETANESVADLFREFFQSRRTI